MSKISVTTIAGLTSGGDANKVIIESGDTLQVDSNATVGGTLTTNGGVTLGGTTPTLTIGDAGAEDSKIVFDGNAQDFHIGLDDSADSLTIGLGSALGTTSHMVIDANGHVTMPSQPAVQAKVTSTVSNITANALYTIPFATEVFDQNADFNNSTYIFTAPATGKYYVGVSATLGGLPTASAYFQYSIQTSNRNYNITTDPDAFDSAPVYYGFTFNVLADMDANDTFIVKLLVEGSTNTADIYPETYLSIFLAC